MIGTEDLRGQRFGTLTVEQFERRFPELSWRCVCSQCGTKQVHLHRRLQSGAASCGNTACGKTPTKSSSSGADTITIQTATRSRDSAEAREYMRPILERERAQQAAREQAEQAEAARKAATEAENAAYTAKLKAEYRSYANHAMSVWNQQLETLPTLQQWFRMGSDARKIIAERLAKNPEQPLTVTVT